MGVNLISQEKIAAKTLEKNVVQRNNVLFQIFLLRKSNYLIITSLGQQHY